MESESIDSMELEGKREDGSWHPCRISLSTDNANSGIVLTFENDKEEDINIIISDREIILSSIRSRSSFIQAGECTQIKEGDPVLALNNGPSRSFFFDAIVEKVNRVRHSNRVLCRCTFEIKWLAPNLESEIVTVPSKYVMRLSDERIETHPVFTALVNSSSPNIEKESPSLYGLLGKYSAESELDGLLAKQVEEIGKLADEMDCSKVNNNNDKVNKKGLKQSKEATILSPELTFSNTQNGSRRITRSQNKQEIDPIFKKQTDNNNKSTTFLSPLAARAALASLICKFPVTELIKKDLHICPPENLNLNSDALKDKSEEILTSSAVSGRVTRSAAKREAVKNPTVFKNEKDLENDSLKEGREDIGTPKKMENKRRKSLSLSGDSSTTTDVMHDSGTFSQDAQSEPLVKKKVNALRKQPTRFSPRLASLSKTSE